MRLLSLTGLANPQGRSAVVRDLVYLVVYLGAGLAPLVVCGDEPQPTAGFAPSASEIDRRLEAHWQAQGIKPAALATDTEAFRRLMLDLTGRIPTRSEWEAYLADKTPAE